MRKTYVTTMPDKSGAFLKASECLARLNINMTRVSYNKAVDTHTLFIEAEGDADKLELAAEELRKIGYITDGKKTQSVMLIEFMIEDRPGELEKILEVIRRFDFNISYISVNPKGMGYQPLRMGLLVDDDEKFSIFLKEIEALCPVNVIEYDTSEVNFDNSIFYQTFVDKLAADAQLDEDQKPRLAVAVNRVMQLLDERKLSPKTTFDCIAKFATHLSKYKGDAFCPRISTYDITPNTSITVIEPPSGSNTTIIKSNNKYLFVDSGYSAYKSEMIKIFNELTGGFDKIDKAALLTHADVDHTGLLHLFDKIYASDKSKQCLTLEYNKKRSFREQNPLHIPYVRICKLLTSYIPADPDNVEVICHTDDERDEPLYKSGEFAFGELKFDIYSGQGGHVPGEMVLVDSEHKVAFSGDIFVNLHDYTPEQAEHNKYAPILMNSVDTDAALAKVERNRFLKLVSEPGWRVFCGHGRMKEF